jgi:flagellin-like hook-associated protein FlgL
MTGSISGVTNYAQLLDTQRSLSRQQTELSFLQKELSTGRKRDGLIGVAFESLQKQGLGSDTIRAQQYRQTSVQANIYLRAIDATQYRTDLYNQSILNLQTIVNDMNAELLKAQTTVPSVYTVQQGLINSSLSRVESILNTTDGQRFVFAGNAYATKPVKTLNTLDNAALVAGVNGFAAATNSPPRNATFANAVQTVPFTAPVNTAQFAGDGNTSVPGYVATTLDSAAPAAANGQWVYSEVGLSIDDSLKVNFGINATHGAFQNLINGLRNFKMAMRWAQNTPNTYLQQDPSGNAQQYYAQAQAQLQQAVRDLASLSGANGANQALLKTIRVNQEDLSDTAVASADKIVAVDIGQVGTNIKGVQASLEASYITTRDLLNLNLAKFLR